MAALQACGEWRRVCPEGSPSRWTREARLCPLCAHKAPCRLRLAWVPRCGAGRGSGGTFPGGSLVLPAFSLRPGVGRGPSQGHEPGQGAGSCCASTVHCGPRLRSPLGKRLRAPICGSGPGVGGPAGTESTPGAGCWPRSALAARASLHASSPAPTGRPLLGTQVLVLSFLLRLRGLGAEGLSCWGGRHRRNPSACVGSSGTRAC